MSIDPKSAVHLFSTQFGGKPEILARAPGRVNLIGEHTDYNDGFVLPMAIDRDTVIAARPRRDRVLCIHAANFDATGEFPLGTRKRSAPYPWADYVLGVAQQIEMLGKPIHGADCVLVGDVPIGAGLSSSASVEMAALALFEAMGEFRLEPGEAALLGRRVENDYIGVASGIMDQFIVRAGRAGHALFLDCRSLRCEHVPIAMDDVLFVVADTKVARGLAGSAYNERVRECSEAVELLNQATGKHAPRLRDFSLDDLDACGESMPESVRRRARHVITENTRTLDACKALRAGDTARVGELFNGSDESLRAHYEVTCPELDLMTSIGRSQPGCFGSRMTGAGFGGCTVHLVRASAAEEFCATLHWEYAAATGIQSCPFTAAPSAGVSMFEIE